MILYDLAAEDENLRFSPYCWRARLALAHKGFEPELRPWHFTEKDRIADSGQPLVPVLHDGDRIVSDSWTIACYLDETYPDRPALFDSPQARAEARFITVWGETAVHPILVRTVIVDIHGQSHPKDRDYFRTSREKRFGQTLEEYAWPVAKGLEALRSAFAPARALLAKGQPFLSGELPAYADYAILGNLQFGRVFISEPLFLSDDPVAQWLERMLDANGGLGRALKQVRRKEVGS